MYYASRLIILLGGQLKASTKKLTAQSKGLTYNYGIQTKIKVLKNQLPNPFTVTYEGEVICTPHGMIGVEKPDVEAYRKQYAGKERLRDCIGKASCAASAGSRRDAGNAYSGIPSDPVGLVYGRNVRKNHEKSFWIMCLLCPFCIMGLY